MTVRLAMAMLAMGCLGSGVLVIVPGCAGQSALDEHAEPLSGVASYYDHDFAGHRTASGEIYDPRRFTAAHRTLPFGTRVRVTNLSNRRQVVVRINDRGPLRTDRLIDLSRHAARSLGMLHAGVAHVRLELLPDGHARP